MPLTAGGVALLAWGPLGVALPAAVLLGASLAPTDPVLASDVQVGGPTLEGDVDEIDEKDEVRFALTSEAGLNDGLAFPFVYLAIFLASAGPVLEWLPRWVAWEAVGKVAVGVLAGVLVGWGMARLAFRAPARSLRLAEVGEPLLALAALLVAYGAAELIGGYGFLAVFACALTVRSRERDHDYHQHMHDIIHRLETLLTLVVLLGLGFAITNGLLAHLDWRGVLVGVLLVLVIRPLAGYLSFLGHGARSGSRTEDVPGLDAQERLAVAFFGVRGVGSIYYVAYAAGHATFPQERWLWSTVGFAVALSVGVHGVLATPVMRRLDLRREPEPKSA
jgi:NhaP-type Na+/H+ or K+/H+ antiporter